MVIACPGRLLDLIKQNAIRLDEVEMLVIDEADRMFDMGFLPDIRRILSKLPRDRQNLFFSATMPKEIRSLTDEVLSKPHVVELAHSAPASTIEHALCPVASERKVDLLVHLLGQEDYRSAIVFLRTKHRARRLARQLCNAGHNAIALQGNMSQNARDKAMAGFRDGRFDVLVATDIASRGLDVDRVSHVINFDVPSTVDTYTHRIGRTGRSERSGKAFTFVTPDDAEVVRAIRRQLGEVPTLEVDGFDARTPRRAGTAPARPRAAAPGRSRPVDGSRNARNRPARRRRGRRRRRPAASVS